MPEANAKANPGHTPGALELSEETRDRLAELRAVSAKAEAGDTEARKELKQKLRESSPEVIARASDIGRKAQHILIRGRQWRSSAHRTRAVGAPRHDAL